MINIALLTIFPLCMAYAAASDMLTMRIPNFISIGLMASFVAIAFALGLSAGEIGMHLLCGLAVLAGGFALFAAGWIGGGDAKLAAAIATWFGWGSILEFLVLGSVLGGGLTLMMLLWRRWPLPARLHGSEWIMRLHEPKQGVPYGMALAAAALHLYPATHVWTRLTVN